MLQKKVPFCLSTRLAFLVVLIMAKKGEKKASRVNDIITREYTINMHKRLMGQYVPMPKLPAPSVQT